MTTPKLARLPDGLKTMGDVGAASALGEWLMDCARLGGEASLDYAIGAGWPGTLAQKALMPVAHIDSARNEAIQRASWGQ